MVDNRGVQRERALHANLEANLAHSEGFLHAVTGATNHHTLDYLNTRAGAFHDVDVDFDSTTPLKWSVQRLDTPEQALRS